MLKRSWLQLLGRVLKRYRGNLGKVPPSKVVVFIPRLQCLEDRTLLSGVNFTTVAQSEPATAALTQNGFGDIPGLTATVQTTGQYHLSASTTFQNTSTSGGTEVGVQLVVDGQVVEQRIVSFAPNSATFQQSLSLDADLSLTARQFVEVKASALTGSATFAGSNATQDLRLIQFVPPPASTGINLSGSSVPEFRPVGTLVGTLSSTEAGSHVFTYSLVSGTGSTDNASFTISGNQLLTNDAFDFVAKSSYSIRVRTTDETGQTFEQPFIISISDDPALTRTGQTLSVAGTSGNDTFTFAAGSVRYAMNLNGVALAADTATVKTVIFQGNGGSDTAILTGLGAGEKATLTPTSGQLQGSSYKAQANGTSSITVIGGLGDSATLADSGQSATFTATPSTSLLVGPGFSEQAAGFGTVAGLSSAGSNVAYLYDTAGNDTVSIVPGASISASQASLVGSGLSEQAFGFAVVAALHTARGADTAYLYDSPASDTFAATPSYATLVAGTGFVEQAYNFPTVAAVHSAGGSDTAYLYDTTGNATFVANPTYASMTGPGFNNQANGFAAVAGIASGGYDTAVLYGSAGNDTFSGTPSSSLFAGSGFQLQALGFRTVNAIGNGGSDTAYLYDGPGGNTFTGSANIATLSGSGYALNLQSFADVVALAVNGSSDHKVLLSPLDYAFTALGNWQ
jgi:hypothetical protein